MTEQEKIELSILKKIFQKHGVPFSKNKEGQVSEDEIRECSRDMTPVLELLTKDLEELEKEIGKDALTSEDCYIEIQLPMFLDSEKIRNHVISYVGDKPYVVCAFTFSTRIVSIRYARIISDGKIDVDTCLAKTHDLKVYEWWDKNFGCDIAKGENTSGGLGDKSLASYLVKKANRVVY